MVKCLAFVTFVAFVLCFDMQLLLYFDIPIKAMDQNQWENEPNYWNVEEVFFKGSNVKNISWIRL